MKILMVGALYFANFGDLLFSKLFYNELQKYHDKADIYIYETPTYKINDVCRQELSYENYFHLNMLKDMDALVYISGGYFDVRGTTLKAHFSWYMKYALPGNYFTKHGKKIYVLGVGGGDFVWKKGEEIAKRILNAAEVVCVRNLETKQKLVNKGIQREIIVHSDTAQAISGTVCMNQECITHQKQIFLHVIPQQDKVDLMMKSVIPAVKRFIENKSYKVIVGYDGVVREKYKKILKGIVTYLGNDKATFYDYLTIDDMIQTLLGCDIIVTPKLHAGIVGCSLGKSVLSFPVDYNKTHRYFDDIGYSERCIDLRNVQENEVVEALKTYSAINITVPSEKVESARQTLRICEQVRDIQ